MILQPDELCTKQLRYAYLEGICHIALHQCGIFDAELHFVSDTGNLIFCANVADQAYSIRICQQDWTTPELLGELYWLLRLRKDTNLIVPEPIATLSGHLIQEIAIPDTEDQFQVILFHWIPGEIIGTNVDAETVRQVGNLMAELHIHATAFDLPSDVYRDKTDWRGMGQFTAGLTTDQVMKIKGFLSRSQLDLCETAAQQVASAIDKVDDQQHFGLIHSDLHTNNCLSCNGEIGVIDFDDCQFAPFTCDMATTMSSFDDLPNREILGEAFLQGYAEKRQLPPNHMAEIEAFMIERRLRLIRWVSTWPSIDHFSFGQRVVDTSLRYCKQYIETGANSPTQHKPDTATP